MSQTSQAEPDAVVQAVGAAVIDPAGQILLVERGRPPGVGSWTLPGGRPKEGEPLEEAVVREVREETALRTRVVCPLGVVRIEREGFRYAIHEFLLAPLDDDALPRAGDDAKKARWVVRSDLLALGVAADAVAVVDRALVEGLARGILRC